MSDPTVLTTCTMGRFALADPRKSRYAPNPRWSHVCVFASGRQLDDIGPLFLQPSRRTIALLGSPGAGKSELARRLAGQVACAYQGSVRWFSALDDRPTLASLVSQTTASTLYVLDDLDALPEGDHATVLALIQSLPWGSHALLISQWLIFPADLVTVVGRLTKEEVFGLERSELAGALENHVWLPDVTRRNPVLGRVLEHVLSVPVDEKDDLLVFLRNYRQSRLVDDTGRPFRGDDERNRARASELALANGALLGYIGQHPLDVYRLTSREFEQLVAEALTLHGYEVTLTPIGKDGGKDVLVASHSALGTALYVVECKRYAPNRPVGVDIVRQLHGVVQAERFTGGIVATTSHFTREARQFTDRVKYQLSLADFSGVSSWIRTALADNGTA